MGMASVYSPSSEDNQKDLENIRLLDHALAALPPSPLQLTVSDGPSIALPTALSELLKAAVHVMAQGQALSLVPVSSALTTTQAAEILKISRPYLMKLLEQGSIPYHQVGTHHRILLQDLLDYQNQRDVFRQEGLQKLVDLSEEYGLYQLSSEIDPADE